MKIYQSKRRRFRIVEKTLRNEEKRFKIEWKYIPRFEFFSFLETWYKSKDRYRTFEEAKAYIERLIVNDKNEYQEKIVKSRVL